MVNTVKFPIRTDQYGMNTELPGKKFKLGQLNKPKEVNIVTNNEISFRQMKSQERPVRGPTMAYENKSMNSVGSTIH